MLHRLLPPGQPSWCLVLIFLWPFCSSGQVFVPRERRLGSSYPEILNTTKCSVHVACAALGRVGNCCPTDDGDTLDCCDTSSLELKPASDCWHPCGGKAGACHWCGVDYACCRTGWPNPPECDHADFTSTSGWYHQCVRMANSTTNAADAWGLNPHWARFATTLQPSNDMVTTASPVQTLMALGDDCWRACEEKGGFCDRCGSGRACCKAGYPVPSECENVSGFVSPAFALPTQGNHQCVMTGASRIRNSSSSDNSTFTHTSTMTSYLVVDFYGTTSTSVTTSSSITTSLTTPTISHMASVSCMVGDEVQAIWAGDGETKNGTIVSTSNLGLVTINWKDRSTNYRHVLLTAVTRNGAPCHEVFSTTLTTNTITSSYIPSRSYDPAEKAVMRLTLLNVDYTMLASQPPVFHDWTVWFADQLAAEIGNGTTPSDIQITLASGSLVVNALISPPAGEDVESMQWKLCSKTELAKRMEGKLAYLEGIAYLSTGEVTIADATTCPYSTSTAYTTSTGSMRSHFVKESAAFEITGGSGIPQWLFPVVSCILAFAIAFSCVSSECSKADQDDEMEDASARTNGGSSSAGSWRTPRSSAREVPLKMSARGSSRSEPGYMQCPSEPDDACQPSFDVVTVTEEGLCVQHLDGISRLDGVPLHDPTPLLGRVRVMEPDPASVDVVTVTEEGLCVHHLDGISRLDGVPLHDPRPLLGRMRVSEEYA